MAGEALAVRGSEDRHGVRGWTRVGQGLMIFCARAMTFQDELTSLVSSCARGTRHAGLIIG